MTLEFLEDGVFTRPRANSFLEHSDIADRVAMWIKTHQSHPRIADARAWLEAFVDQYSYLSPEMPQRQHMEATMEIARISSKEFEESQSKARLAQEAKRGHKP